MSRKMIIAGFVVSTLLLLAIFGSWKAGWLYFRLSDAKIALNGAHSDESKIYRSGTGDYLIFLETEGASFPVYAVTNDGEHVGIPASPIPSSFTKSVKTDYLVLCLQCSVVLAGTDKFDLNADVSASSEEIAFRVSGDSVIVKF